MQVILDPSIATDQWSILLTLAAPTPASPAARCFVRRYGEVVVFEVEYDNASIERGLPGWRQFDCNVAVSTIRDWNLVEDCPRPLPIRWYPMHACVRRYALYPKAKQAILAGEATRLAQCPIDVTKLRRTRTRFGPANLPMPNLSPAQVSAMKVRVSGWYSILYGALRNGTIAQTEDYQVGPVTPSVFGWRPGGDPAPYAQAGSGIYFFTGHEQALICGPYYWLEGSTCHERRWHTYDRATGRIIIAEDYGDPGPMYQQGTGDPNNGWLPEWRGIATHPDPIIPSYDASHSIRGFRHLIALSEMCDSPMVRRMIASQAAQFRLQYSEIGPHPTPNYIPPSLRTWLGWARNAPHTGHLGQDEGRRLGWIAAIIAQSIKLGRSENVAWARMAVELAETAAMPTGIYPRCHGSGPGDVWYDPLYDTAHAFEVPIFWFGIAACARQVGLATPGAMMTAFAELYETAPLYPYYSGVGPPQYAYVAHRDGAPLAHITGGKGNAGDSTHVEAGCALAASEDGNHSRWIAAARRIDASKVNALATATDLREGAGLLAVMQAP